MSKVLATNDPLIEEVVKSENYICRENGDVYTCITRSGKKSVKGFWRRAGFSDKQGYRHFNYKNKKIPIHRLIYRKFIGPLDQTLTINHKDGDPANNKVENLELITQGENNRHSYRVIGRRKKPVHQFKITMQIAALIRHDHKDGLSYNKLVEKYGLSKSNISYIVNEKTWK